MAIELNEVGRVPTPGDNVAIASRRLETGTRIHHDGRQVVIAHTVLEGHRFAHIDIREGEALLSWGLPFGTALRDIAAGEYVCNGRILEMLTTRRMDARVPQAENFADHDEPYRLDQSAIHVGSQVESSPEPCFFEGYWRGAERGVGTRNYVVVLGMTSLSTAWVRALVDRFRDVSQRYPNIDGVVAVSHTEGGTVRPNNLELVLRVLSGLMVHPNVAAVLVADFGDEALDAVLLRRFLQTHHYPLHKVLHRFLTPADGSGLRETLEEGRGIVEDWLETANSFKRTKQSAVHLKLALQCGGSDAFSGISANPLAGWIAREVIRCGGSGNLAETAELVGAEAYILSHVREPDTARAFLEKIELFKERAAWHGHDVEGNPSGGNYLRGLYNNTIKSIGAARKKHPQVRLDYVIDYGRRMQSPGFYFMDSPGNDLESVAGQVASGANLILFTTGSGSITNFPLVPTIKIVTTTGRYDLLREEMDVNAGRYLDGAPMDQVGSEAFSLALRVASGLRSAGERSGHYQTQIWRNWQQTDASRLSRITSAPAPARGPLPIRPSGRAVAGSATFGAFRTDRGYACDQVAVIVPTSLCSGQIAQLITNDLNDRGFQRKVVSRYVAFVHTEGCGASSGDNEELYIRTLLGHVTHPMVRCALFLEHGCEKTHNGVMWNALTASGLDGERFGWASVQMDGGFQTVRQKVMGWFDRTLASCAEPVHEEVGLSELTLGLTAEGPVDDPVAKALAELVSAVATIGGTVVLPSNASLLECKAFVDSLFISGRLDPSLAYGQCPKQRGFHIMDAPTGHLCESLTGLGATGVQTILAHVWKRAIPAHPLIPVVQCSGRLNTRDMDCIIDPRSTDANEIFDRLLDLVLTTASRRYTPALVKTGYTDFQVTRGLLGISL